MNVEVRICSSLEKIFRAKAPRPATAEFTALQHETFNFQIALFPDTPVTRGTFCEVKASSELPVRVYREGYVPAQLLFITDADKNYLTKDPGLFPDPLYEISSSEIPLLCGQWNALWVEAETGSAPAGEYPVSLDITIKNLLKPGESTCLHIERSIRVIPAALPHQDLRYTCWFHGDCLADYYHIPVFSEEHFTAMENQIRMAAHYGQNTLLTPLFTPPLDTAVGKERTTIQLVDVKKTGEDTYEFGYEKMRRFIRMAQDAGIECFEMSHLFTQWGGTSCPKILDTATGEKLFGWENEALSPAYKAFLTAFLPSLANELRALGLEGKVYFHLTDEPHGEEHLQQYLKLKSFVTPLIEGFPIMDALSDYSFYEQGATRCPVVATSALRPFLEGKRPEEFWVYYCIAQGHSNLSNRFLAMPGERTRILGVQLYLEKIHGFLHWGLNFYNSVDSKEPINPYETTDGKGFFPAGDPFILYPGENFTSRPSTRLLIFHEALQDLRALTLLESCAGREAVEALIREGAQEPVTFESYPRGEDYLLLLRQKVNRAIEKALKEA